MFVLLVAAFVLAIEETMVLHPVRATEAHKQPCAGLLEDGRSVLRVFSKVVVKTRRTRRRRKSTWI